MILNQLNKIIYPKTPIFDNIFTEIKLKFL